MGEVSTNDVLDRIQNLSIENKENEFEIDYGPRLRLVKRALLIQEIGNQLHCSIITIAKAQVLYHQFQRLESNVEFNTLHLSAVCLNLSIKLCQDNVTTEEVILKFYHSTQDLDAVTNTVRPDPSPEELQDMKRNLCLIEYAVCKLMAFKLQSRVAHTYIFKFLAQLQSLPDVSDSVIVSVSSAIIKLLSTYYMCEGCVDFTANEIAIACLQFAFLFCGGITSSAKFIMRKELTSVSDRKRIVNILDELISVSVLSTKFNKI